MVALEAHQAAGKPTAAFASIAVNPTVRQAQLELTRLESELNYAQKSSGANSTSTQQIALKVEAAREALERVAEHEVRLVHAQVEVAELAERERRAKVIATQDLMTEWETGRVQDETLQAELTVAQECYSDLARRAKETEINARNHRREIAVIDRAVPPLKPFSPSISRTMGFGWLSGICMFCCGIWLRKHGRSEIPMSSNHTESPA